MDRNAGEHSTPDEDVRCVAVLYRQYYGAYASQVVEDRTYSINHWD